MSLLRRSVLVGIDPVAHQLALACGGERIDLSPQCKGDSLTHVTIQLDAGGHNLVRVESDDKDDKEKDKAGEQKLPISVAAKLAYDERRLDRRRRDTQPAPPLAVRYYDTAEAVIKVDDSGRTPQLPDDRRLIVLEQAEQRPALVLPGCAALARAARPHRRGRRLVQRRSPAAHQAGGRRAIRGPTTPRSWARCSRSIPSPCAKCKACWMSSTPISPRSGSPASSTARPTAPPRSKKFAACISSIASCTASRG